MKIKTITVYSEMTMKGRQDFSSRKYGGTVTAELEDGEDIRQAFHRAWLIAQSEVLRKINETIGVPETQAEQLKIDSELKF